MISIKQNKVRRSERVHKSYLVSPKEAENDLWPILKCRHSYMTHTRYGTIHIFVFHLLSHENFTSHIALIKTIITKVWMFHCQLKFCKYFMQNWICFHREDVDELLFIFKPILYWRFNDIQTYYRKLLIRYVWLHRTKVTLNTLGCLRRRSTKCNYRWPRKTNRKNKSHGNFILIQRTLFFVWL